MSPESKFESLLLYIIPEERDLVNTALLEDLLGKEHEELLDLVDCMDPKSIQTKQLVSHTLCDGTPPATQIKSVTPMHQHFQLCLFLDTILFTYLFKLG